ncbi:MAG TPA: trypsin-like peptidase domain-containing protein [Candidatus Marinimicrobia bacterium]|nr:trypsin-like peptidase domain-containing protein [Candidatus Neomarinimicrobiota bacterium]HRS51818.1 trypsin-like peptidase domain-containing protein [Candidatus Neomarinimicrobiota bacterium]HRU92630.1 trypsin-like peptidase domain-containing protein [Candidatus Neomarinimicrobiota bacterium]
MRKILLLSIILLLIPIKIFTQDIFDIFSKGTPEEVNKAIKAGVNVNERDSSGFTPLMIAARYNENPKVIETLIKSGAKINDCNYDGITPLMFAALNTINPEIITILLKYGADKKIKDNTGNNAFIYANMNENIKATPLLVELKMSEKDFKKYYMQNINILDPIEGIWTCSIDYISYFDNVLLKPVTNQNKYRIAITKNKEKYDCQIIDSDNKYPWIEFQKTASFLHYLVDIQEIDNLSRYNVNAICDGYYTLEFEYSLTNNDIQNLFKDFGKKYPDKIRNIMNVDNYDAFIEKMAPRIDMKESYSLLKIYPTIDDKKDLYTGSATCFAISNKGYFVTNYHVIANVETIMIRGINGNYNESYKANVVSSDKNNDLAVLKISPDSVKISGSIPFCINSKLSDIGESVYVLGYPLRATMGDEIKLTNGIISSKTGFQGDISCYQISAPVQPGNSGAPVFNTRGVLIGVISGKHLDAENVSYTIKSSYLYSLIEVLPEKIEMRTSQEPTFQSYSLTKQADIMKRYIYIIETY